jgi:hypothetical protein
MTMVTKEEAGVYNPVPAKRKKSGLPLTGPLINTPLEQIRMANPFHNRTIAISVINSFPIAA